MLTAWLTVETAAAEVMGVDVVAGLVLLWVAVALACLAAGGRRLLRSARLHRHGVEVTGVIIESQFRSGKLSGRVWFRPVVAFVTADGERVRAIGPIAGKAAFRRGTRVIVRYRWDQPNVIEIIDGPADGAGAAGYVFTGLLLLVVLVTLVVAVGGMA
jgi:Protein of unknown function (DUF3592)